MEYRELGKTELKVPVLSYGASSLGGVFILLKKVRLYSLFLQQ